MSTEAAAVGTIGEDLPCLACGYNLRGLRADGLCPECGAGIEESVLCQAAQGRAGWPLRLSSRRWVKGLAAGATWVLVAGAVRVTAVGMVFVQPLDGWMIWMHHVQPFMMAWGIWRLTAPEPDVREAPREWASRMTGRILGMGWPLYWMFTVLTSQNWRGSPQFRWTIWATFAGALTWAGMMRLAGLARRMGRPRLQGWATAMAWVMPAAALVRTVWVPVILMGPTNRWYMPPDPMLGEAWSVILLPVSLYHYPRGDREVALWMATAALAAIATAVVAGTAWALWQTEPRDQAAKNR